MAHKNKNKNKNNPLMGQRQFNKVVLKWECPFAWDMDSISKEHNKDYFLNDDEYLIPVLQLMTEVMKLYVNTKARVNREELLEELKTCDVIFNYFKDHGHPEISTEIVGYIVGCTVYIVLTDLNMPERRRTIFTDLKTEWKVKNAKEMSTFKACKGICWSKDEHVGLFEAEQLMRDAIKDNPNCELWHFVLGKILRRKRIGDTAIAEGPSKTEFKSFAKAYNMSPNPLYGVYLAQVYQEMRKMNDAEKIYDKLLEDNPTGIAILLRMTFGFLRMKNNTKANECLAKAGSECATHRMFLCYHDIYHFDYKKNKEAAEFLENASKDHNISTEKRQLDCVIILNKSFDVVQYLVDMVHKADHTPDEETDGLLHLAFSNWMKNIDTPRTILVHCTITGQHWVFVNEDDYTPPSVTGAHSSSTGTGAHSSSTGTGAQSSSAETGAQSSSAETGAQSSSTETDAQSSSTETDAQSSSAETDSQSSSAETSAQSSSAGTTAQSSST